MLERYEGKRSRTDLRRGVGRVIASSSDGDTHKKMVPDTDSTCILHLQLFFTWKSV